MEARDTKASSKSSIYLSFMCELGGLGVDVFKFNCNLFPRGDISTKINIPFELNLVR
jgi:hypothetical protein